MPPRKRLMNEIVETRELAPSIGKFKVKAPEIAGRYHAGQFAARGSSSSKMT
jgi:NAD(P)H-flavin reductase